MSYFAKVLADRLQNFRKEGSSYSGHIDHQEGFASFLTAINAAGYSFSTRNSKIYNDQGQICFTRNGRGSSEREISIPFFGCPFRVEKSSRYDCAQGEKYYKSKTGQQQTSSSATVLADHPSGQKKRLLLQPTKKMGCPAFMSVQCIRVFEESKYQCISYSRHGCSKITKLLKTDIALDSPPPVSYLRYIVYLSHEDVHTHRIESTNLKQSLHPAIKEEICNLVKKNVCSVKNIKFHLGMLVEKMFEGLQPPDKLNKGFYPSDKDIRNHVYLALFQTNKTKFDQEALEENIKEWKKESPDDTFFFRPYQCPDDSVENKDDDAGSSTLLFCHQTKWQRDLLLRYGNNISLLDATYKTTKYSLPLFFLAVKTNSGYSVVGTFVVHSESSVLISEALSIFASWNEEWKPKYFMTDFSEAEIKALEATFPESTVYLCAFHREQSWQRWLHKSGNVPKGAADPIKSLWRAIAKSKTEEEFQANIDILNTSELYSECPLAQKYFNHQWLPQAHRWVAAFHTNDFLSKVNTNNGIESQNKVFKHSYLKHSYDKTITGMLRLVIKEYLPDSIAKYVKNNAKMTSSYKPFSKNVPSFLHNRPLHFIKHIMNRHAKADLEYRLERIQDMTEGLFCVESEANSEELYHVDMKNVSCSCHDFYTWRLPCKHMCAIFIFTDWHFEMLPDDYTKNPYITVDMAYAANMEVTQEEVDVQPDVVMEQCEINPRSSQTLDEEQLVSSELPTLTRSQGVSMPQLREKLKILMDHTYLLDSQHPIAIQFEQVLNDWEPKVRSALSCTDEGLVVDPSLQENITLIHKKNIQSRLHIPLKPVHQKYLNLPSRKKKGNNSQKHVGRFGAVADKWRVASGNVEMPI